MPFFYLVAALALKGNEVLSELRLALCNIGSDGIVQLCEALTDIPTLRVLNLSGNTVDLLGAKKLGEYCGRRIYFVYLLPNYCETCVVAL